MQVRFRKNYITRQNEPEWKRDAEGNDLRAYGSRNVNILHDVKTLTGKNNIERDGINDPVENCIGPTACQVPESLSRYIPCKGFMKKIDDTNNDMSGPG